VYLWRSLAVGVLVLVVVGGCSTDSEVSTAPTASPSATGPVSASDEPTIVSPTSAAPTEPPTVTIAVAGDVHFEGVLRERLDDPASALLTATAALAEADLAIVNLETSVGVGGRREPGKRYTFQAPPTAFKALAASGIDVVTMANNHALDFGRTPLPATFRAIRAARSHRPSLAVVGLGKNAEAAFRPAIVERKGVSVAVLGASTAGSDPTADSTAQWPATDTRAGTADAIDPRRLLRAVRQANRDADIVVVFMHWGMQGESCADDVQRTLAARLVRSGADIVVGSHSHTLQGDGRLGRGYVAYGLGNYVWYTPGSSPTGVLTLSTRPPTDPAHPAAHARVTRAVWSPALIGTDGLPTPAIAPEREDFANDRARLRACSDLRSP
jgi:poly-gamma-glutamate synthesis protein (capsule biosynthesis protein)